MDITLILVTLLSFVVAATMSVVAWRILRDERKRSAARIAALAAEIHDDPVSAHENLSPREVVDGFLSLPTPPVASTAHLFETTHERSRLPLFATIAALVVGAAAAATILFGGAGGAVVSEPSSRTASPVQPNPESPSAESGGGAASQVVRRASVSAPLELVALGHERDADGLTVRGVLRNPSSGAEVNDLTAVVLLFNRDGRYVASGRAAVQAATLGPGGETTFVVTVSGAPDVERYRVSFRTETKVVPHVDMRS